LRPKLQYYNTPVRLLSELTVKHPIRNSHVKQVTVHVIGGKSKNTKYVATVKKECLVEENVKGQVVNAGNESGQPGNAGNATASGQLRNAGNATASGQPGNEAEQNFLF
jgi:hypothetical protein